MSETRACPGCAALVPQAAKFCPECGTRLDGGVPASEVRKVVSLLFCDLVGSTALGERLDPEAFRRVQLGYYATCEALSTVTAERSRSSSATRSSVSSGFRSRARTTPFRACRAALDLVAGIRDLNVQLEAEWGVRLSVRIGVNTGAIVAGEPSQGGLGVTGDAVNTAARLEQAAGSDEVLIGAHDPSARRGQGPVRARPAARAEGQGRARSGLATCGHGRRRTAGTVRRPPSARRPRERAREHRSLARGLTRGCRDVSCARWRGYREVPPAGRGRRRHVSSHVLGPLPALRRGDHIQAPRRLARRPRRRTRRAGDREQGRGQAALRHRARERRRRRWRRSSTPPVHSCESSANRPISCFSQRTSTGPSRPCSTSSCRCRASRESPSSRLPDPELLEARPDLARGSQDVRVELAPLSARSRGVSSCRQRRPDLAERRARAGRRRGWRAIR